MTTDASTDYIPRRRIEHFESDERAMAMAGPRPSSVQTYRKLLEEALDNLGERLGILRDRLEAELLRPRGPEGDINVSDRDVASYDWRSGMGADLERQAGRIVGFTELVGELLDRLDV